MSFMYREMWSNETDTDKLEGRKYDSTVATNFDLQAALYYSLEYKKPVFYKRKIAVFNFAIYEVAKKKAIVLLGCEQRKLRE
jgi:hypothetical protein